MPLLERARERGKAKAEAVRARPGNQRRSRFELGEELVRRSALRAGLLGAATGTLALFTLPISLPRASRARSSSRRSSSSPCSRSTGSTAAASWGGCASPRSGWGRSCRRRQERRAARLANLLGRALAGTLPARPIARLEPALLRAILKRFGLGFVPRLFKLWPILAAPIGFVLDRAALRALGRSALDALERGGLEGRTRERREAPFAP